MRITYIQQHFALPTEAGFVRAWEFSRRLVEDGHEVTVIRGGAISSVEERDGVKIQTVRAPYENEMRFRRRIRAFIEFAVGASMAAIQSRPDVAIASSTPLTVAVPAMLATLGRRRSFVFEVRDLWPSVPVELGLVTNPLTILAARALEKIAYRRSDHVIALSPGMAAGVRNTAPRARVTVVPNGCDLDKFDAAEVDSAAIRARSGVPEGAKHIVYAGGFGYMYDLPWCIDLASNLIDQNVFFTFIGKGSESENLEKLARSAGIYRDGMFPGRLGKNQVIDYLRTADAVLSPLRESPALEVCSLNKVFDAMAAAKPVFLNHGGWLTEAVEKAGSGWRISRDVDSASSLICRVISDEDLVLKAGINNRKLGEAEFDRDNQYEEFKGVLLSAATLARPYPDARVEL